MTLRINNITFDAANPYTLARFWSAATGYEEDPDDPNGADDAETGIRSPDGSTTLLFIRVPEGKYVKNRVHLDLAPTDSTRNEEFARLVGLGATLLDDQRRSDGSGWIVMQDPEGNEFCIERSEAERASR